MKTEAFQKHEPLSFRTKNSSIQDMSLADLAQISSKKTPSKAAAGDVDVGGPNS